MQIKDHVSSSEVETLSKIEKSELRDLNTSDTWELIPRGTENSNCHSPKEGVRNGVTSMLWC